MGALEVLAGRTYGPFDLRIDPARLYAFVEATGDDPDRWQVFAPPSFAGAVLFAAAPGFFADPDAASHKDLLIHGEQVFKWKAPWRSGGGLTITGRIERLRERGTTAFATFAAEAADYRGREVMSSRSLFLMSSENPPGGQTAERPEPPPEARRANRRAAPRVLPAEGGALDPLPKSASRADLVRYAAASGDFNPIHWDHGRALESGVGGVICHGLLLAAWVTQPAASAAADRGDPLVRARIRFRRPLYPGQAAQVNTAVTKRTAGSADLEAEVVSEAGRHASATIIARTA